MTNALVLNGSPSDGGASSALADHAASYLMEKGATVVQLNMLAAMRMDISGLLNSCEAADLIVLSFPVFMGSLPSHVIEWMEIASQREGMGKGTAFLAVGQGAHPSPAEVDPAIRCLEHFCRHIGWRWAGGLGMGMGLVLEKGPLERRRAARHTVAGLDMALEAVMKGEATPEAARKRFSRRAKTTFAYLMFANRYWKRRSKRNRSHDRMMDRPLMR
ncbi:MAG: NADPH-dependent FMN reductase [Methanomassiliicoccales archaeon PtaU1.Bin124]|nr:MAG: NADPH-dependent FMN reductase [Methanomassiliicoccales archaeon PtaU1.Bin124]